MRKTRLLLLALVLTCLCGAASASAYGTAYGPAGRLPIASVTDGMGNVSALTDSSTATAWTGAVGDRLTITLYSADVGEIWIQNGHCYSQNYYNHYDRPDVVSVTLWYDASRYAEESVTYRYRLTDAYRPGVRSGGWMDGYQRLLLPQRIDNVNRIELTVESAVQGYGRTGAAMTDLAVTRGQHATATPRRATATPRPYVQYITPTPGPVVVPTVEPIVPTRDVVIVPPEDDDPLVEFITPKPTKPAVELITPEPADDPALYPSEGVLAKLDERMYTRSGPGAGYDELGGFGQKGTEINVISKVWDKVNELYWLQAEVWRDDGWRRVYTADKYLTFDVSLVPDETTEALRCRMTTTMPARYGPGEEYGYKEAYPVKKGTTAYLYIIEGDWGQVEYNTQGVRRRAWVPLSTLEEAPQ